MKIVGIDIGYGFLKIRDKQKKYIIPSVVGNAVDLTFELMPTEGFNLDNLCVQIDGEKYFVGNLAIVQAEHPYRSLSVDRTTDMVTKVMFLTGLALTTPESVESYTVVTGLPVKDYLLFKDTYVDNFTGTHEIFLNGEKRIIHVSKVVVVPQPYGTYCDGLFNEDGSVDENFADNHVGIIDIGYKTSDFVQVKKYTYLEKYSSTSSNGISSIYKDVANYLSSKFSIYKEDYELEEIIQKGYCKTRGGNIDISKELEKSKKMLAKKIGNEIKTLWNNYPEINSILITGGGGALLYHELMEVLGDDIVLVNDPQVSNVNGYCNWGHYLEDAL